jgi:hypothetical protein
MADTTRDSNLILHEAKQSLDTNRAGGFHRRSGASIGRHSRSMKRNHLTRKLFNIFLAIFGIWVAAGVVGWIINGIGFPGVMLTLLASVVALYVFGKFPRMKVPQRSELNRGDVKQLVGRTELWLEAQRPALPPPAVTLIDQIGVQLDTLGKQLETVDQEHPSAREVRKLVGEHLPEMVDSYRKIPAHLRKEQRAGSTPDEQLVDSLGKISGEIDSVTRQLAQGSLDDLAIRTRFLEYKYGDEAAGTN